MKALKLTIHNIGIIEDVTIEINKPELVFYGDIMQGKRFNAVGTRPTTKLCRRVGRRKATMNTETQTPHPVGSSAWFDSVFDVLKNIGGAHESMRKDFIYRHTSESPCDEYRFQGKLGLGGKYWRRENRVSCYREDETPERLRLIIELDAALAKLSNNADQRLVR